MSGLAPLDAERIVMDQQTVRLTVEDREIVLLGTAHVSRDCVDEDRRVIAAEKPDRVCVELDEGRYTAMIQGSSWQKVIGSSIPPAAAVCRTDCSYGSFVLARIGAKE